MFAITVRPGSELTPVLQHLNALNAYQRSEVFLKMPAALNEPTTEMSDVQHVAFL